MDFRRKYAHGGEIVGESETLQVRSFVLLQHVTLKRCGHLADGRAPGRTLRVEVTRTIDLPTVHNARVERPSQAGAPASGPAERTPRAHPPASPAFLLTRYREATYAAALSAAIAPSETAVTTWRRPFARTSPAANTPGTLVAPDSSATT